MRRRQPEIVVSGQQRKVVPNAKLREHGVNRTDLDTCTTATIPQFRGLYMILAIRRQNRQRREPVNDLVAHSRPGETLQ